jgi:hypothetical protein
MTNARTAQIPMDHIVAEVAAFPLASEAALRLAVIGLDEELDPPTGALWREAERQILGGFPAISVEEVVGIRDKVWFADRGACRRITLGVHLRSVARKFLKASAAAALPTLPDAPWEGEASNSGPRAARARRAWRWVSFALPPDLLIAALDDDLGPYDVQLVSPAVDRLLRDQTFAETHLHIGAAPAFPVLWVAALHAVARPELRVSAFHSPGAALGEGEQLAAWLVHAAVARYILAAYLARDGRDDSLPEFLAARVAEPLEGPGTYAILIRALSDLGQGRVPDRGAGPSFPAWQDLYARLTRVTTRRLPDRPELVPEADPVAPFFPARGLLGPTPEMRFVAAALAHLEARPEDGLFAVLFWQTVRVRALFYRHVVQRPMTPGLQWFIRFYGRIKPAREPIISPGLQFESAAQVSGVGMGLKSLEVRSSPSNSVSDLYRFVVAVDRAAAAVERREAKLHRTFEAGLVLHFNKDRGGRTREGLPAADWLWSHCDPRARLEADLLAPGDRPAPDLIGNPTGYRYARFYTLKRREAQAFAGVLRTFPVSLEVLRGLDVCTDELGVPNWVLVPLFRHVRHAADFACRQVRHAFGPSCASGMHGVPPLRTTVHTGEDFVHLLTGLRRVGEALGHFGLREGDRIGHGLALGVDPRDWVRRAGRLPLAREERLFDLAWEWDMAGQHKGLATAHRFQFLDREIRQLSERMFGNPLEPADVVALAADLYDPEALALAGFPDGRVPRRPERDRPEIQRFFRLVDFLTDRAVFINGRVIEWVDPADEGDSLANLQAALRADVAGRGITVEVNPTSNLLIGDLHDLTAHPLWRLRPPREGIDCGPSVSVCIGSDDPVTFGTTLRQEYQLLHDALLLSGFSDEEARRWIDRTRASGLESRFTVPRSRSLRINALRCPNADPEPIVP